MYFMTAALIIAISASVITIRTLCAYSVFSVILKWLISLLIIMGWFAPLILGILRRHDLLRGEAFAIAHNVFYSLFGFAFILFCLLMFRDLLWFCAEGIGKIFNIKKDFLNPLNPTYLNWSNLAVGLISFILTIYAGYEAVKQPEVKEVVLHSEKIKQPIDIVFVSDIHANQTTSLKRLKKLVSQIKGLRPDIVLLGGDIVDDRPKRMQAQVRVLGEIKAKYGSYIALGNHEFYSGLPEWLVTFPAMKYVLLYNSAAHIRDLNLLIGGIPDYETTKYAGISAAPNIAKILTAEGEEKETNPYRILLSHSPRFVEKMPAKSFDLVLSGHTHGGQIFPFHYMVKWVNHYLAGLSEVNQTKLYVSRGYGTWGPNMRLLAPSELTLIRLLPKDGK